jgi:hypothetical protein
VCSRIKYDLWLEAQALHAHLIRLSGEADSAYLKYPHTPARADRSRRLGRLAIQAGKRALRRLRALVQEQEERIQLRVYQGDT